MSMKKAVVVTVAGLMLGGVPLNSGALLVSANDSTMVQQDNESDVMKLGEQDLSQFNEYGWQ